MVRRYDEPVEVRTLDGRPQSFVWRGQLFTVRTLTGRWYQRSAWWRDPGRHTLTDLSLERRFWRVEAGRWGGSVTGVFDLAEGEPWLLVRTLD